VGLEELGEEAVPREPLCAAVRAVLLLKGCMDLLKGLNDCLEWLLKARLAVAVIPVPEEPLLLFDPAARRSAALSGRLEVPQLVGKAPSLARRTRMDIPGYESLMPRVLRLATVLTSGADAVQQTSDELELTEEQRRIKIPSGTKSLIKSRIDWAVTYLVHAGLMERPRRGTFVITDRGRQCLERDGPRIDKKYLYQFAEFREFLARRREPIVSDEAASGPETTTSPGGNVPSLRELELGPTVTPDEQLGQAYELIKSEVRSQLLDRILGQSPEFFENLVVTLLSTMGYGSSDALAQELDEALYVL
jgi:hypothetical protein